MKQILLVAALALTSQFANAAALPPTIPSNPQQPLTPKPIVTNLTVHEWGTFTSVMGSNGLRVGGLHHEEETLPSFIVGRNVLGENLEALAPPGSGHGGGSHCQSVKGIDVCDDNTLSPTPISQPQYKVTPEVVTQKMETPVLYFYSDEKIQSRVTVGFPKGIISQYYPAPISFLPALGKIEGLSGGQVTFDVEVTTEKLALPKVEHGNVYAPARQVASNDIRSGDQNEKFIFYRGLGDFATSLIINSNLNDGITLQNYGLKISNVILLDVTSTTGAVKSLGALESKSTKHVTDKEFNDFRAAKLSREQFEAEAQKVIVQALVESGLYKDESLAMFNTWKSSYLKSNGLRALYILSRKETDTILPISITPEPQELVRTLVGRIEIFHASEEQQLLKDFRAGKRPLINADDRFAEPKLRRLLTLVDISERYYITKMINDLN
ncbi:hypothetical protein CIK05_02120 [Bdellovibrio sp. qaytius]|nr:hypothetical protein CIK05_02120 [Bdellovibrio sp. qaytius]